MCTKCLNLFKSRKELLLHKKTNCIFQKHENKVKVKVKKKEHFICEYEGCSKEFSTRRQFTRHKKRHLLILAEKRKTPKKENFDNQSSHFGKAPLINFDRSK